MKFVVTGGGGFLGRALCMRLRDMGHEVHSIARGRYPELDARGVVCHQADLALPSRDWHPALAGAHAVFHTAAKVDHWGPYPAFFAANVSATRHVLDACRAQHVERLVYTSSPSVLFDGRDLRGADESVPYPVRHLCHYGSTKALAEQEVLAANGADLFTVALRPHMIWGPGPCKLIERIQRMAADRRLVQLGDGKNEMGTCYIDDAVDAHLAAMQRLEPRSPVGGQAYFICHDVPVTFASFVTAIVARSGLRSRPRILPRSIAELLARGGEALARFMPDDWQPPVTRYLLFLSGGEHHFKITRARRDLGFAPRVDLETGLALTFGTR